MTETEPRRVLGVGAIIFDDDDRLLLVLRGHAPQAGRWSIPGGKVEPGESLEAAVAREVLEETGLDVRVGRRAWVVDIPARSRDGVVVYEVHDFVADVVGGALTAGDDAADARWVPMRELANLSLTDGLVEYLERYGFLR